MARRTVGPKRSLGGQIVLLVAILLFCVFPFYWMVTTSLKTQVAALESPPLWIFQPTLENYREVLWEDGVGFTMINSLIVAIGTTLLALGLGTRRPSPSPVSSSAARSTSGSGSSPIGWSRPSSWLSPSS